MKKILIVFTLILSVLGVTRVSAATDYLKEPYVVYSLYSSNDNYVSGIPNDFDISLIYDTIDRVIKEYKETKSKDYPYYFISLYSALSKFEVTLLYYSEVPSFNFTDTYILTLSNYGERVTNAISYSINYESKEVKFNPNFTIRNYLTFSFSNNSISSFSYYPISYYYSNFDLYMPPLSTLGEVMSNYKGLILPPMFGEGLSPVIDLNRDDFLIEPAYIYDTNSNLHPDNDKYIEVNLNSYAYIALSLKDYNVTEPFSVNNYVKGQYCVTPVYDYGLQTKDSVSGAKVQDRCTTYYDNFTPVRTYILDSDIKNHSIYYLKAYDNSKENIVKIDTSIFNIHYITEEEKNNPILEINGKKYSAIPYDDLPSTATKNEEENYVPGASEKFDIGDVFSKPLEFFQKIFDSISAFNSLISQMFSFLPTEIRAFLWFSIIICLTIGIVKVIL